ncbi:ATP-binding protein [Streptomyces sp. NPDC087294]|uniref:sensor histidine kinase n=1 Tax=Streptomyces sp. NPDC087294 TaxID=3365777 RepID=UPI00382A1084
MNGLASRTRSATTALRHRLGPRTLRGRLSLVALTTATLLMVVLTVAFNAVAQQRLRHQADDELRTRAAAVATTVDTGGTTVRVLETSHDDVLDADVWIYAGRRLLEAPPNAGSLTRVADALAGRGGQRCVTADLHGPLRLCSRPVPGPHGDAMVVTALDLSPYRSSADTLLVGSLTLDAVMLACTYALTRLAVGRALRPVRTMTEQAVQGSAVASGERFGSTRHPAELARLGTSLDSLLDRIRTLLRHERQLTGELSHELRTPLSRIIAELDWWRTRPRTAEQTRASHQVISEAAESMRTICDTLLNDARDDADTAASPAGTASGTAEVLPTVRGLIDALDLPGHLTVAADGAGPTAGVPPALLARIVSPLLANARRYARSRITVRAYRAPGGAPGRVHIDVIDDGPGVPPAFRDRLFQPGRRADPGDGHGGAGLGLPLARRLARAAGGEVTFDPGYGPGARFVISLPAG